MKNFFLILTTLITAQLFGQSDQTLFSDVKRVGAFGGPIFEYSNLDEDVETATGGGGAFVLDDFFLGGYGIGDVELNKPGTENAVDVNERVKFKHGGFWLGYVPMQNKVIHPYTSLRLGWGKARYLKTEAVGGGELSELNDNIFVLSPEAGIELNVFSFFRVSATATYRLVNGVDDVPNYSNSDLSGFGAVLTLRFGGFGSYWD